LNQLPIPPKYRVVGNSEKFNTLRDAASQIDKLTLNDNYYIHIKKLPLSIKKNYNILANELSINGEITRPTLFKEIEAVTADITPNIKSILNRKLKRNSISLKKYGDILLKSIMDHLNNVWDDSALYVMSHSSGYDSRLISRIIKELGKKNIRFICFQPEIEEFKKIMAYEGWASDHIITIKEDAPLLDYFAEAVDFVKVGKHSSDVSKFITYCFRYVLSKEIEKMSGDVRIISGLHADELLVSRRSRPAYFTVRMMHDIFFEWGEYDPLLPFLSVGFLNHYVKYNISVSTNEIKKSMISILDPHLFDLENYKWKYRKYIKLTGTHPVYSISKGIRNGMLKSFNRSWYCRELNKNINLPLYISNKDDNYREYTKAAICEYFIDNDYKIMRGQYV